MSFKEICQKIKLLISSILNKDQELEEKKKHYHLKVNESVSLLVDALKQVAPIRIKYSRSNTLGNYNGKIMVWHQEYGVGLKNKSVEPLKTGEDFKVDSFVDLIKNQLEETLQKIDNENNDIINKTENLEELIGILKQWQKSSEE